MDAGRPISFMVDEHFPQSAMRGILVGHALNFVTIAAKDQEILRSAEINAQVVLTSDTWFLKELYRLPFGHARCFREAGVIQLPGEWDKAARRLQQYLPVIDAVYRLSQARPDDHRVGIDLSQSLIHIRDPWI